MDARVKPAHDAEFVARTLPLTYSHVKQPAFACATAAKHSSAARVLWRAPGSPVFPCPSSPSRNVRGDGAPIGAAIPDGHASLRRRGASRRATRGDFCPWRRASGKEQGPVGPLIRAASAALRPRRVQPSKAAGHNAGGRLARASRGRGYESRPRAPHRRCRVTPISAPLRRLHHRDVSRRRPQSSRTLTMIRARKRAGISFLMERFQDVGAPATRQRPQKAVSIDSRPILLLSGHPSAQPTGRRRARSGHYDFPNRRRNKD